MFVAADVREVEAIDRVVSAAVARRVEQSNPGVVDTMSSFYAQHPTLVKTLGSAALMIAMRKIAEQHTQNA